MATYNELNLEMQHALAANIENLQKKGETIVPVKSGVLISDKGGMFLYEFTCSNPSVLEEDSEIEVRVDTVSNYGTVVSISEEGKVRVALEEFAGPKIPQATLISSAYQLLQKLMQHLELLRNETLKHNDTADKLFGLIPFHVNEDSLYKFYIGEDRLNDDQERAARLSLGSEVSFIWGPPGTGKTFTIARLVEALLHKGKTILLISHTNAATDGALLSVVSHLESNDDYLDGKLVRVGKISNETLAKKNVTVENIAKSRSKETEEAIQKANEERAKIDEYLTRHNEAQQLLDDLHEIESEQKNLHSFLSKAKDDGKTLLENIKTLESTINHFDERIVEHQNKGALKKLFSGKSLEKMIAERRDLRFELGKQKTKIQNLRKEYKSSLLRYQSNEKLLKKEALKLKRAGLIENDKLEAFKAKQAELKEYVASLQQELSDMEDNIVSNAKLIATTLTKSYQTKSVILRDYDCVIVDESSMAPLPALLCAAGLAKEKIIIVGDCYQLSPIAKFNMSDRPTEKELTQFKLVELWLKRNIYDLLGITSQIEKGNIPKFMRQLRPQNRMHPDISALVNEIVYARKNPDFGLKNMRGTDRIGEELLAKKPLAGEHLGIYDTSKLKSIPTRAESNSTYNIPHAFLIIELIKQAIESGYKNIGAISAYRAQVELIKRLVEDTLTPDDITKVKVDTVHKFQGGEKDIIIFDVTTPKRGSMYDNEDQESERLINVAFSRAKAKCLIVCDVDKIVKGDSPYSLVLSAINHIDKNKKPIIDATEIAPKELISREIDKLFEIKIQPGVDLKKAMVLIKDEAFYDVFQRDVSKAKKELIILSPFITDYRAEKLAPLFSNFLLKGGKIYILTRPPELQTDNMREMSSRWIQKFEKMGIYVLPLPRITKMHEKVAIIDRKILYHGSLNILSFRDSGEDMIRFTSALGNFPVRYMKETGLMKNIGEEAGIVKLRHCEICKLPGAWYWTERGMYGFWTRCLAGNHTPGKPPKEIKTIEERRAMRTAKRSQIIINREGIPLCPLHKTPTVFKQGRPPFTDYYECPQFRECDYRLNINRLNKFKAEHGKLQEPSLL